MVTSRPLSYAECTHVEAVHAPLLVIILMVTSLPFAVPLTDIQRLGFCYGCGYDYGTGVGQVAESRS